MKRIFITKPLNKIAKTILQTNFDVIENTSEILLKKDLIEIVQTYDGILCTIGDDLNKDILNYATKLKVISNYAVGLDNIDVDFAKEKGIKVYNLPNIVTNSTADTTFAIFFALVRKICEARRFVRENNWKRWKADLFLGEEFFDKNFGILGFGRIGKAVANRARGFGMNVIFCHYRKIDSEFCRQVSLEELLETSDYLSLHVPLTDKTERMVDLKFMEKMKKKPILINMARGSVIKTDDLVIALEKGILRGAALDVTDPEPLPGTHPLCKFDNCLITPHIGTSTRECRYEMAKKASESIINFFGYGNF